MFLGQNIMVMSNLAEFFILKNCGRSHGPRSWWTMMVPWHGDLRSDTFLYKQRLTCFLVRISCWCQIWRNFSFWKIVGGATVHDHGGPWWFHVMAIYGTTHFYISNVSHVSRSEYHADVKSGWIFHVEKLWAEPRSTIMVDHDGFMSWWFTERNIFI